MGYIDSAVLKGRGFGPKQDIDFGELLANKYLVPPFVVRFGGEFGLAMGILARRYLVKIRTIPLIGVVEARLGKGSNETVVI